MSGNIFDILAECLPSEELQVTTETPSRTEIISHCIPSPPPSSAPSINDRHVTSETQIPCSSPGFAVDLSEPQYSGVDIGNKQAPVSEYSPEEDDLMELFPPLVISEVRLEDQKPPSPVFNHPLNLGFDPIKYEPMICLEVMSLDSQASPIFSDNPLESSSSLVQKLFGERSFHSILESLSTKFIESNPSEHSEINDDHENSRCSSSSECLSELFGSLSPLFFTPQNTFINSQRTESSCSQNSVDDVFSMKDSESSTSIVNYFPPLLNRIGEGSEFETSKSIKICPQAFSSTILDEKLLKLATDPLLDVQNGEKFDPVFASMEPKSDSKFALSIFTVKQANAASSACIQNYAVKEIYENVGSYFKDKYRNDRKRKNEDRKPPKPHFTDSKRHKISDDVTKLEELDNCSIYDEINSVIRFNNQTLGKKRTLRKKSCSSRKVSKSNEIDAKFESRDESLNLNIKSVVEIEVKNETSNSDESESQFRSLNELNKMSSSMENINKSNGIVANFESSVESLDSNLEPVVEIKLKFENEISNSDAIEFQCRSLNELNELLDIKSDNLTEVTQKICETLKTLEHKLLDVEGKNKKMDPKIIQSKRVYKSFYQQALIKCGIYGTAAPNWNETFGKRPPNLIELELYHKTNESTNLLEEFVKNWNKDTGILEFGLMEIYKEYLIKQAERARKSGLEGNIYMASFVSPAMNFAQRIIKIYWNCNSEQSLDTKNRLHRIIEAKMLKLRQEHLSAAVMNFNSMDSAVNFKFARRKNVKLSAIEVSERAERRREMTLLVNQIRKSSSNPKYTGGNVKHSLRIDRPPMVIDNTNYIRRDVKRDEEWRRIISGTTFHADLASTNFMAEQNNASASSSVSQFSIPEAHPMSFPIRPPIFKPTVFPRSKPDAINSSSKSPDFERREVFNLAQTSMPMHKYTPRPPTPNSQPEIRQVLECPPPKMVRHTIRPAILRRPTQQTFQTVPAKAKTPTSNIYTMPMSNRTSVTIPPKSTTSYPQLITPPNPGHNLSPVILNTNRPRMSVSCSNATSFVNKPLYSFARQTTMQYCPSMLMQRHPLMQVRVPPPLKYVVLQPPKQLGGSSNVVGAKGVTESDSCNNIESLRRKSVSAQPEMPLFNVGESEISQTKAANSAVSPDLRGKTERGNIQDPEVIFID